MNAGNPEHEVGLPRNPDAADAAEFDRIAADLKSANRSVTIHREAHAVQVCIPAGVVAVAGFQAWVVRWVNAGWNRDRGCWEERFKTENGNTDTGPSFSDERTGYFVTPAEALAVVREHL